MKMVKGMLLLECFPIPRHVSMQNGCEYLGGFSHHPMVEMTNTKNGRAKMHAKLLC
jgi:hypothetical protein